jgi:hypothetical protein
MRLIAQTRPAVPVTAYLCLAENLPDRNAQRPGDIYRARNGKWIHVDNTDAEGRLVLADVLAYACEEGATHVVDVATLTGACMVALGERIAGLMGRHESFLQLVRAAGLEAGEEFWPLPLYGEYRTLLDHPHADLNNAGGRYGGAITAGLFLAEFVPESVKWAHLDIAGPAIQTGGWRYYAKGMTGFSTRFRRQARGASALALAAAGGDAALSGGDRRGSDGLVVVVRRAVLPLDAARLGRPHPGHAGVWPRRAVGPGLPPHPGAGAGPLDPRRLRTARRPRASAGCHGGVPPGG